MNPGSLCIRAERDAMSTEIYSGVKIHSDDFWFDYNSNEGEINPGTICIIISSKITGREMKTAGTSDDLVYVVAPTVIGWDLEDLYDDIAR